jgi:hypothetical protein
MLLQWTQILTAFGLVLAVSGCATKPIAVDLRSVLDEASQNELGPTARLSDKDLTIEGIVVRTGMKTEWSREGSIRSLGFGVATGESHNVATQVAFAVIEPGDGNPGRCMCFFESVWLEELATYKPKSKIRVRARLQRFLRQDAHEVLAADCEFMD